MSNYLYRLTPPRSTFPGDITAAEGVAMQSHFAYWSEQISRRTAVVYGPVADPKGRYGIAILNVPSETEARTICTNDPAITANLGFAFELHEMPDAIVS